MRPPQPVPPGAAAPREPAGHPRRRAWRVRQRYLHHRPTVAALLDQARLLEAAMRTAGIAIEPASVLIRTDGLSVAVTVEAVPAAAAATARTLIAQLAADAGIHPDQLGEPGEASVRPGWRTPPR